MPNRSTQTVSFTVEQAEFVKECVNSGRYQTVSEVVREGLRLLAHEEALRAAALEKARAMIAEGAGQYTRGGTRDADEVFARLHPQRHASSPGEDQT